MIIIPGLALKTKVRLHLEDGSFIYISSDKRVVLRIEAPIQIKVDRVDDQNNFLPKAPPKGDSSKFRKREHE